MRLRGVHGKPGDALSHMPLRDIPRRGHITEGPRSQPGWHGPLQPEPVRSGTEWLAGVRQDRMQFARRAHDDSGDAQPQGRHLVMRWDDHIDIYPQVLGGGDGKPRWWPVFREHLRLAIDRYRERRPKRNLRRRVLRQDRSPHSHVLTGSLHALIVTAHDAA